jgi:hypothetical protein
MVTHTYIPHSIPKSMPTGHPLASYELLDEVLDYGVPQSTNTEALKNFVLNEPTVIVPQVRIV